jgi:geranylgeranyl transferase type-2 subunit beta
MTTTKLLTDLHVKYIQSLGQVCFSFFLRDSLIRMDNYVQNKDDLTYHLTAHLRLNAIYWGLAALCIMKHKHALGREEMIEFALSCWDDEGGKCGSCSTQVGS